MASEPWLDRHIFNESEMALFSECMLVCAQKMLDTAGIVREPMFRQFSEFSVQNWTFFWCGL
jgi:hypothetical protein